MKKDNTEGMQMPSVSEPEATYTRLSPNHHAIPNTSFLRSSSSRQGRMSVDEFCDILHEYVDEYYEGIQG